MLPLSSRRGGNGGAAVCGLAEGQPDLPRVNQVDGQW